MSADTAGEKIQRLIAMSHLRASENYVWSIEDKLGEGASGSVYKARHKVRRHFNTLKTHVTHNFYRRETVVG